MSQTFREIFDEISETYHDRNATYGDSYLHIGKLYQALFPDGLTLSTEHDFARLASLNMVLSKLIRYCHNWENGGHRDSIIDISAYAVMIAEIDEYFDPLREGDAWQETTPTRIQEFCEDRIPTATVGHSPR